MSVSKHLLFVNDHLTLMTKPENGKWSTTHIGKET